jgi:hypothetical protein
MRDLRDYLVKSKDGASLNPGSPFNIKESSVSLANFSSEDVQNLLGQHTMKTGQIFEKNAIHAIYEMTRGQPWLVNYLAKKCHWELCKNGETVTLDHVREAKEMLIRERAVHLDSLAERLKDPRVHRVVEAIITGTGEAILTRHDDDVRLSMDLGLVDWTSADGFVISNPLYREIIARVLSSPWHDTMPMPQFQWKNSDGSLDLKALLLEFQDFWSQHADIWEEKADYTEAFPHLLLMAFLQRVVNGGGRIEREYAAGRGRVDLAVHYGGQWSVIEIKLLSRQGYERVLNSGLRQVEQYADRIDPKAPMALVIFDRTPAGHQKSWEERIGYEEMQTESGRMVMVFGG